MKEMVTERQNLFEPNNQMGFYIEMSYVCYEDLKNAIETAYLNNEVTCSRIVLTGDGQAFYEKMDHSGCRVERSHLEWKELLNQQEKIPFVLEEGEMVRCFIHEFDDKTGLFIYAHHVVADGKGMMCFINDVMNALCHKPLTYKPLNILTKEAIEKEYKLPWIVKAYVTFSNVRYKLFVNKVCQWDDYYGINQHYWNQYESKIMHHTFTKEETDKIKIIAKKENVSVNTFLTTAFIKHIKGKKVVGWIMSLRDKGNETMANLISGAWVSMRYNRNLSFGDNARKVHKRIQGAISFLKHFVISFLSSLSPNMIDHILLHKHGYKKHPLMEEMCVVTGYKGNIMSRDIGITNLTVLDVAHKFEHYVIDQLIVVAPLISYTKTVICSSTFNGQLTLAYHDMVYKGKDNSAYFKQVLNNIKECLK